MSGEGTSEHLDDGQVRAKAEELLPIVEGWVQRLSMPPLPAPGSELAADDAAVVTGMQVSHLSHISLAVGSEHLLTALTHSISHGPGIFAMQTLYRTALIGGAQAVWLLSPPDRPTRVARAEQLSKDSYRNMLFWANELDGDPRLVDPTQVAAIRAVLAGLTADTARFEVNMSDVIRLAAHDLTSD